MRDEESGSRDEDRGTEYLEARRETALK